MPLARQGSFGQKDKRRSWKSDSEHREKKATKDPTIAYSLMSQSATYKVFLFNIFCPRDFSLQKEAHNKMW